MLFQLHGLIIPCFLPMQKICHATLKKVAEQNYEHVILNLEECPSLESTSIEELLSLAKHLQEQQIDQELARVCRSVAHNLLYLNSPLFPQSSYDSQSVDDAVHQLESSASAAN